MIHRRLLFVAGAVLGTLAGCNNHPLQPLEKVVSGSNRQNVSLPAKTKIDFLFVIDDSGSMSEEQEALAENFSELSGFLVRELGDRADFRIAVTTTDYTSLRGEFVREGGADPAGCVDEPLVIGSDNLEGQADPESELNRMISCKVRLATQANSYEKGLEAMRGALSCTGPNAELFRQCCQDNGTYDPVCDIPADIFKECGSPEDNGGDCLPRFLRPDAILVVVFMSDEDDCSYPAINPSTSYLAVCRTDRDGNGDGFFDGFSDVTICGDRDPATCYADECGALSQSDCYEARCVIPENSDTITSCAWYQDRKTPTDRYRDFLLDTKIDPEFLLLAALTGPPRFVPVATDIDGDRVGFSAPSGTVADECIFEPLSGGAEQQAQQKARNEGRLQDAACCPAGGCEGSPYLSCESDRGLAFDGARYTELVELFGVDGVGCTDPSDAENCIQICEDSFSRPLNIIRDRLEAKIRSFCLDKAPQCIVPTAEGPRECETAEEFASEANYANSLRVSTRECVLDDQGECTGVYDPSVALAGNRWSLERNEVCRGDWLLTLDEAPGASARVLIDVVVQVNDSGDGQDAGAAGGAADAGAP